MAKRILNFDKAQCKAVTTLFIEKNTIIAQAQKAVDEAVKKYNEEFGEILEDSFKVKSIPENGKFIFNKENSKVVGMEWEEEDVGKGKDKDVDADADAEAAVTTPKVSTTPATLPPVE